MLDNTQFNQEYFKKYEKKNIFNLEKGDRPFLYDFWMRKLKKLAPKEAKILEVGCGGGYFLKRLEKKYDAVGMDISQESLKLARKRTKVPLYIGSAEKLPFGNNSFSVLIAFDIIEHLDNPEKFFREAHRVICDSGFLIISTPNPESFGNWIKGRKPEWKELSYEKRMQEWHGWRDDTHINIRSIDIWRDNLKNSGFEIINDGTDTLWDIPYFRYIPYNLQRAFFMPVHWILTWIFGFFPWKFGENYICIAKRVEEY